MILCDSNSLSKCLKDRCLCTDNNISIIFQLFVVFLLVYVYNGSELILITLCGLLANEFVMLKDDLSRAMPNNNNENGESVIEEFIKKHQKLIK